MALAVGMQGQHDYLKRFGLLDTLQTELPEAGAPIVPKMPWAKVTTDHHGVRPRHLGLADADGGGRRGAGQWRLSHHADLPAAHAGAGGAASPGRS